MLLFKNLVSEPDTEWELIEPLPPAKAVVADKGYDKLKRNYESVVAMACGFLWLRM